MASDFRPRMLARAAQVGEASTKLVAAVGNEVGTGLVLETPVDTGEARSNWLASRNAPRGDTVSPSPPAPGTPSAG